MHFLCSYSRATMEFADGYSCALFGVYGLMRTALGENNTFWAAGDLRLGDFSVRMRDDLQAIRDNRLDAPYGIFARYPIGIGFIE